VGTSISHLLILFHEGSDVIGSGSKKQKVDLKDDSEYEKDRNIKLEHNKQV
jgi:hypothetical protein